MPTNDDTRKVVEIKFEVYEDSLEEIDNLVRTLGLESRRHFFNYVLSLAAWCVKERLNGRIIASIDEPTNRYKELEMSIVKGELKGE